VICTAPEQEVYYLGLKNIYWQFSDKNQAAALKLIWHGLDTYNPMMAKVVGSILKTEHPDIAHTNNLGGFSVAVWRVIKKYGFPLIHTLRDHYLLCPRSSMFKDQKNCQHQCIKCRLYALPRQRATEQVDSVVGISRFILNRHVALGCFEKVKRQQVIFNAYDGKTPQNIQKTPKKNHLGQINPIKGLDIF
jgi:glycosyltransferase involved in cell wall biosynthesis